MEWSDRAPEAPGFYWYFGEWVIDVVRVYKSKSGPLKAAGTVMFEGKRLEDLDGRWAGPIPGPAAATAGSSAPAGTGGHPPAEP